MNVMIAYRKGLVRIAAYQDAAKQKLSIAIIAYIGLFWVETG